MKIPVVITEKEYNKGKNLFKKWESMIIWVPCAADENVVAEEIKRTSAKIVVLGVEQYRGLLYTALSSQDSEKPSLIVRYGVGHDGVNKELCRKHNIFLVNTPGALDQSVAEHVFALLLSAVRKIPDLSVSMKNGLFNPKTGLELKEKVLGIAGFGNIGKKVGLIGAKGFGMKVIAYDILPLTERCGIEGMDKNTFLTSYGVHRYKNDFEDFAAAADIISVHIPVLPETDKFFNTQRFEAMKPGSIFINTGRGRLVNEISLYNAITSGHIGYACLDVFQNEPYVPVDLNHDFRKLENVVLTPHVASDTIEANQNTQQIIMKNIESFTRGNYKDLNRVV